MADHQDLTGRSAVHPFAFVQGTDPALDAENAVEANKAWIDTSSGAIMKIRNGANTAWIDVLVGQPQTAQGFTPITEVVAVQLEPNGSTLWTQITHL